MSDAGAASNMSSDSLSGSASPRPPGAPAYDARQEDVLLSIPAFANAANRALNEKLVARTRALARASSELTEHQERTSVMADHMKAIRSDLMSAQRLAESKAKELATEKHLGALAERAVGRARQDLASLNGKEDELRSSITAVQAAIDRGAAQLESFKTQMNWKQSELEKWTQQARQKEEDRLALEQCVSRDCHCLWGAVLVWEALLIIRPPPPPLLPPSPQTLSRYTRADEQRIKDLTRELERLTGTAAALKKQLASEATETAAKQVELDKAAEEFRELHMERQTLIAQWQASLAAITVRDMEIAQAGSRFAALKAQMNAKKERLAEAQSRLDSLERENSEMQLRQESVNRSVGAARDSLVKHTKRVEAAREEVELIKNEVLGAAGELSSTRAQNEQLQREIEERKRNVVAARAQVDDIKARRAAALQASSSVEEAVSKKEAFIKREVQRVERLEKEVASLREAGIKANNTLAKLREEQDLTRLNIASSERANKSLRDRLAELDEKAAHQAKHAYSADFLISQLERKVRLHAGGRRPNTSQYTT